MKPPKKQVKIEVNSSFGNRLINNSFLISAKDRGDFYINAYLYSKGITTVQQKLNINTKTKHIGKKPTYKAYFKQTASKPISKVFGSTLALPQPDKPTQRQNPKNRFCQRTASAFGQQIGFFAYFDQL